jgi:hypothetical protein
VAGGGELGSINGSSGIWGCGMANDLDEKMHDYERETTAEWARSVLDNNTLASRAMFLSVKEFVAANWFDLGAIAPGSEQEVAEAADYLEWRGHLFRKQGTKYAHLLSAEESISPAPTRTMTLGELMDALQAKSCGMRVLISSQMITLNPTFLRSYRGDYSQLALGYEPLPAVGIFDLELYEKLYGAIGELFEGYKGGSYCATRDTPVWIDNPGDMSGLAIVGVDPLQGNLVIHTAVLGE